MTRHSKAVRQQVVAILNVLLLLTIGPGGTGIWPTTAIAQAPDAPPPTALSPDQLDTLVARIALYPDPLLAQVLAASTFTTDVVQANRWLQQHKNLKDQQLTDAVIQANLPYDPSVISLLQFPTVLDMLSQQLDWTSTLGNAVLTQRGDVMDAVQRMRRKAEQVGNLKSSEAIKVVSSPTVIEIQPANPQVIYVPTYNPQVVYVQAPPPPGPSTGAVIATGLISFGLGVAVGAAASNNRCCWYGGSMGWSSHTVVVANNSFNRTWVNRGYPPVPAPYYRGGGGYYGGGYGNVNRNNVNVNNVNVNNVNRNNVNVNNTNVNNVNRNNVNVNNANVNNVNRNNANVNNVNRNNANVNNVNRNNANVNNANLNNVNRNNANVNNANRNNANVNNANRNNANSFNRGGSGASQQAANRGYSRPTGSTEKASAFSGAGNGSSEQAAAQRGNAARRGR